MATDNPYEPAVLEPARPLGRAKKLGLLLPLLLALSMVALSFRSPAFLLLPLIFGCSIPWAMGYHSTTMIVASIAAYLSAYIGIELALGHWRLGTSPSPLQVAAHEQLMTNAAVIGSFIGAWVAIIVRLVLRVYVTSPSAAGEGRIEP